MPSQTFFNLSKEKQQIIYNSAIEEFSRVLFNEASINKIIKNAGISRGSFYMYFESKEDLYKYLVLTQKETLDKVFLTTFNKNKGDIISSYLELIRILVEQIDINQNKNFFKNIVLNTSFKNLTFIPGVISIKDRKNEKGLINYICKDNLKLNNKEDLYDAIDLCNMCLIHALVRIIKCNEEKEFISKKFENQLIMLKKGLYKEEKIWSKYFDI